MSDFMLMPYVQLHWLTPYGPSNLNRDDTGRPKRAHLGGVPRLRISSQSIKRGWRDRWLKEEPFDGRLGTRTQYLPSKVRDRLKQRGLDEAVAAEIAEGVTFPLGKHKEAPEGPVQAALIYLTPDELKQVNEYAEQMAVHYQQHGTVGPLPTERDLLIRHSPSAWDVAMFGRMVAHAPEYNWEAAVQESHAWTTHKAFPQDDFFTSTDDLNRATPAAEFIGVREFGAGIFYHYLCIDVDQLKRNLHYAKHEIRESIRALVEAALTTSPSGMQNSFAHQSYAFYALCEVGPWQPHNLTAAFMDPITGETQVEDSIAALGVWKERIDRGYGRTNEVKSLNTRTGEGTLAQLSRFALQEE